MSFAIHEPLKVRSFTPVNSIPQLVASARPKGHGVALPIKERKSLLRNLYYAVLDNSDYLCEALQKDLHRAPSETKLLELAGILDELKVAISEVDKWAKPTKAAFDIKASLSSPRLTKEPYGTVLVIGPWNYPYLCVVAPILAAIAAGNHVVLKPSEMVPHASEAVTRVLEQALPSHVFATVTGGVEETTVLLKEKFDKICFTGSTGVGKIVSRAAAEHLTPVLLELGGKSPVVVTASANIEIAAKRVAWGRFVNAGQTCIAPDYVLVEESVKQEFIDHLKAAIKRMYPNLTKDSTDYTHIVSDRLWERANNLVKTTNGKVELQWGQPDAASRFFPPTVVSNVKLQDPLMAEELFGPLLPIVTISKAEDALPLIKVNDTPLAFYIFSSNKREIELLKNGVRSGAVLVNDTLMHGATSVLPFGGFGQSGTGSYHGKFGFDAFTHARPAMDQPKLLEGVLGVRYPPYSAKKQGIIQKMMVPLGVWWPRQGDVKKSFQRRMVGRLAIILVLLAAWSLRSKL